MPLSARLLISPASLPAPVEYIIASTPRTGSSLLCDGLTATGIAGRPDEFFAPHLRETWCRRWSLSATASSGDYLATALRHAASANGVIAFKIHWDHVGGFAREAGYTSSDALAGFLPGARFVNIVRRDRLAQALSWFKANETNEWSLFDSDARAPSVGPRLDIGAVRELERQIERQQTSWLEYFATRNLKPLIIDYESISGDYRGTIARVLAFLGLTPSEAAAIPDPRRVRQADEVTGNWRRQIDSLRTLTVIRRAEYGTALPAPFAAFARDAFRSARVPWRVDQPALRRVPSGRCWPAD